MKQFSAEDFSKFENVQILGEKSASFKGVCFDSRTLEKENLFVAVKGQNFDGNDFVERAFEKGAKVAIASRKFLPPENCALIFTESPEKCIQKFAASLRETFCGLVIGIVGSVGKTTTKEFCTNFLSLLDLTYSSKGNKNNLLGLPQSIINGNFEAKYFVLEMGISTPSEMDHLASIAKPNVVIFTSIKPVHLEFLNSLENILFEKSKVLNYLKIPSFFIYNRDDKLLCQLPQKFEIENYSYGFSEDSDLRIEIVDDLGIQGIKTKFTFKKQFVLLHLPFMNRSNIYNFAASYLTALLFSADIKIGEKVISNLPNLEHRGLTYKLKNGAILYDDSYNSNPEALKALLLSAKSWGKEIVGVLGEMKELGKESEKYHYEVGEFSSKILSALFCVGGSYAEKMYDAFKKSSKPCLYSQQLEEGIEFLKLHSNKNSVIIIKGSRSVSLDNLVKKIVEEIGVKQ